MSVAKHDHLRTNESDTSYRVYAWSTQAQPERPAKLTFARRPRSPEVRAGASTDHTPITFWLATDFPVEITLVPEGVMVSDSVVHQYGIGQTPRSALLDYLEALAEYHRYLVEHQNELAPRLRRHLDRLNTLEILQGNAR